MDTDAGKRKAGGVKAPAAKKERGSEKVVRYDIEEGEVVIPSKGAGDWREVIEKEMASTYVRAGEGPRKYSSKRKGEALRRPNLQKQWGRTQENQSTSNYFKLDKPPRDERTLKREETKGRTKNSQLTKVPD